MIFSENRFPLFGIMLQQPRSVAVIAAVVMMVVVMVSMGRDDDDARHDMVMMVVMMVMAHHNADLSELDLVSRRVGEPCIIGL
jgi:uncharacterized integral membrane protein